MRKLLLVFLILCSFNSIGQGITPQGSPTQSYWWKGAWISDSLTVIAYRDTLFPSWYPVSLRKNGAISVSPVSNILSWYSNGLWRSGLTGAPSSTDNAIVRFDGVTGKLIQNSSVIINDTGAIVFPGRSTTIPYTNGQLFYDTPNHSLSFLNNDPNVSLQIGQEEWVYVRNQSGSTIANGSAVYVSGSTVDGVPLVSLAQSNSASTVVSIGLATEAIANNTFGYITTMGVVRGINTSSFSSGASLYISSTVAGGLTSTAPLAPNYRFRIGIVLKSDASTGTIHVTPSVGTLGNGTGNQVFGMNNAGTAQEVKSITGSNGVTVTNAANSIALSADTTNAGILSKVYFKQLGNSFARSQILGSTDSFSLNFITRNTNRLTIDSNGRFTGIYGSTSYRMVPSSDPLDVNTKTWTVGDPVQTGLGMVTGTLGTALIFSSNANTGTNNNFLSFGIATRSQLFNGIPTTNTSFGRILATGEWLINGTTSANSADKLQVVNGNFRITSGLLRLGTFTVDPASSSADLWFRSDLVQMRMNRGGTVTNVLGTPDAILNGTSSEAKSFNITGTGQVGSLISNTTLPTAVYGTGAGSSSTPTSAVISGLSNNSFALTITPSATPAGNATIATFTFSGGLTFPSAPQASISAGNGAAASVTVFRTTTTTTVTLTSTAIPLSSGTSYVFGFIVL